MSEGGMPQATQPWVACDIPPSRFGTREGAWGAGSPEPAPGRDYAFARR